MQQPIFIITRNGPLFILEYSFNQISISEAEGRNHYPYFTLLLPLKVYGTTVIVYLGSPPLDLRYAVPNVLDLERLHMVVHHGEVLAKSPLGVSPRYGAESQGRLHAHWT